MQLPYQFDQRLVFRSPLLPLSDQKIGAQLPDLFNGTLLEALYIASPVLHEELQRNSNKDAQRLRQSLYKYASRAMTRCTPFGLFAGIGVAHWGHDRILRGSIARKTRLDMNYVCGLAQALEKESWMRQLLRYFPNNSIYVSGETLRYVEYRYVDTDRRCQVTAVTVSPLLIHLLEQARTGKTIAELCQLITDDTTDEAERRAFIEELIDARLLVSEIEASVTGTPFEDLLLEHLGTLKAPQHDVLESVCRVLKNTREKIAAVDTCFENAAGVYESIKGELSTLPLHFDNRYLFQTDMFFEASAGGLPAQWQDDLKLAITALIRITTSPEGEVMQNFRKRFYERYGEAEVLLVDVLDEESGIGFDTNTGGQFAPFVEGIHPLQSPPAEEFTWTALQQFLHRKLTETISRGETVCTITDQDLAAFPLRHDDLPATMAVLFRPAGGDNVQLVSCGGSSAGVLLSRFAHGSDAIKTLLVDIATHEQQLHDDSIIAEIAYLPENRIGNVMLRPALHQYEIPYLTRSGLQPDQIIPPGDLLISLRNNGFVLRSKTSGKRILPRLTSAHNFSQMGLPFYRLLCALQSEGQRQSFSFNWGILASQYRFLPRAVYGRTVLFPCSWKFEAADWENTRTYEELVEFCKKWKLPERFLVADGDNLLLIDMTDQTAMDVLLDLMQKRQFLRLEETLQQPASFVKDDQGSEYAGEFVGILLREKKPVAEPAPLIPTSPEVNRSFVPGTEWLYVKLYCGSKTADEVLTQVIAPLVENLETEKIIDKWFWIRYADPDPHLRIRFHSEDPSTLVTLPMQLHTLLQPFGRRIARVQIDTYERELERYGSNAIALTESLFWIDSTCTLQLLSNLEDDEGEVWRWQFGLLSAFAWCSDLCSEEERLPLLETSYANFFNEFGGQKETRLQLDKHYRANRSAVDALFRDTTEQEEIRMMKMWIEERSNRVRQILPALQQQLAGENRTTGGNYAGSLIHMSLNRLHRSSQRLQEFVTYDFLCRTIKSLQARRQKNSGA